MRNWLLAPATFLSIGCTEMVPIRPADVPVGGAHLAIEMTDGTRLDISRGKPRGDRICGYLRKSEGPECEGTEKGMDACVVPEGIASVRQENATTGEKVGGAVLGVGLGGAVVGLVAYGLAAAFRSSFRSWDSGGGGYVSF